MDGELGGGLGVVISQTEYSGIVTGLSDARYHAHPALSSTGARLILESPARFRWAQDHKRQSRAFDVGHAVHAKVLGVGATVEVLDFDDFRTKAAREARDAAYAAGLTPMLAKDMAPIDGMSEAVLAHTQARAILEEIAGREVSIFAEIDGVPTRARFDIYGNGRGSDLKTAVDASPKGFTRAVHTYGLHIQEAWYRAAHKAVTGTELDTFHFLVVEKTPPYLVGVYDLDVMWHDIGAEKAATARERWLQCTEAGVWPGYESQTLTCPTYVVFEHETEFEEIEV